MNELDAMITDGIKVVVAIVIGSTCFLAFAGEGTLKTGLNKLASAWSNL